VNPSFHLRHIYIHRSSGEGVRSFTMMMSNGSRILIQRTSIRVRNATWPGLHVRADGHPCFQIVSDHRSTSRYQSGRLTDSLYDSI
jgi:hypothetical protein